MPLPSLRGALATKQSRGRVMRPLDCFAALAMTGGEVARLFLGVGLDEIYAPRTPFQRGMRERCCGTSGYAMLYRSRQRNRSMPDMQKVSVALTGERVARR